MNPSSSRLLFIRAAILLNGLNYLLVSLALIFAPQWFFDNIGNFPPFNRHYSGDLGAFLLPLGAGLLLAIRNPSKHVGLIGVAALASGLHVANHLYDDFAHGVLTLQLFTNTVPLFVLAVMLGVAYFMLAKQT